MLIYQQSEYMGYDEQHINRESDQVKSKISKMTPQNTNLENEISHRVKLGHNFIRYYVLSTTIVI